MEPIYLDNNATTRCDPFGQFVISSMMGCHDPQAEQAGKRDKYRRSNRMKVQDIRPLERRIKYAKRRV